MPKGLGGAKVLITGGLGFIGINLAARLVDDLDANVTIVTRSDSKRHNIEGIEGRVNVVQGDIEDFDTMKKLVVGVDYLYHLAAQTSNIRSMESPLLDLRTNAGGTLNVLEACRLLNRKAAIVSTGTVTQIGRAQVLPVTESHPLNPLTVYDANKTACEHYMRIYHQRFGIPTVFLRLSTIFGERQHLEGGRTGIVNSFVGKALGGQKLTVFGEGKFKRDFLYVGNVVDALLAVGDSERAWGDSFQVVSGSGTKFIDMVRLLLSVVKQLAGVEGSFQTAPWPDDWRKVDVGDYVGDYTKLNEATKWNPRVGLEEGLERTVRFYMRYGEFYGLKKGGSQRSI